MPRLCHCLLCSITFCNGQLGNGRFDIIHVYIIHASVTAPHGPCNAFLCLPGQASFFAQGYSYDHEVPAGMLMTVFSAPDYPQFLEGERFYNKAAVAQLTAPDYATPSMLQFDAAPRPEVSFSLNVF